MIVNTDWINQTWIPALTSGEFAQGKGWLRLDNRYCCLGVACELLRRDGMLPMWTATDEPGRNSMAFSIDGNVGSLPVAAQAFIGLEDRDIDELINLNDSGFPFSTIADTLQRWYGEEDQT